MCKSMLWEKISKLLDKTGAKSAQKSKSKYHTAAAATKWHEGKVKKPSFETNMQII